MTEFEKRLQAKLPGDDTGITVCRSFCDVCAPGPHCGVDAYVKDGKIIKLEGTKDHPVNHGMLCPKGQAGRQYIYREDRVKTPLKKVDGQFVEISWEQALDEIGQKLNAIKADFGAESVAFFSGYNKWYRPYLQRLAYSFGSPNYGTESSSCFTATSMSWHLATGYDAVSADMGRANVYLGWCCNPYNNMYLMVGGLQKRKVMGMKIIIVDSRKTHAVEQLADLHLQPLPGTDGALALGLARELIVTDRYDKKFVEEKVHGFEEYRRYVMDFTPEKVQAITSVPAEKLKAAADMIWQNLPMAINQSSASLVHHVNGLQNHRAVMALSALMGCFDTPGGVIPVPLTYAHSQGSFETRDHEFAMSVYPKNAPLPVGCDRFPLWHMLVGEMQACDLPRHMTGGGYPIKAVVGHGMNYRMFNGSGNMKAALEKLDLLVIADLFMTDTAMLADYVLPVCSSYERSEFKVYNGGLVQYTKPVIEPLFNSRPDTWVITQLAQRIAPEDVLLCSGYDKCLEWMLQDHDIDLEHLKANSQAPEKLKGFSPTPVGQHAFRTPTGKFELFSTVIHSLGTEHLDPLPTYTDSLGNEDPEAYPMIMMSGPRLAHALHSRGHKVPWLRSLRPHPAVDISVHDGEKLGVHSGDKVRISTPYGSITVLANLSRRMEAGTVSMYHGYSEADVNSIMSGIHNDPYSGFPGYRSFRCRIEKEEQ